MTISSFVPTWAITLGLALALTACGGDKAGSDASADAATEGTNAESASATGFPDATPVSTDGDANTQIAAFAAANGLTNVQFSPEGVGYVIVKPGSQDHPTVSNEVTIHYKGYLVDGKVFDQTKGQPVTFPLTRLVQAWQVAIPMIGRGGEVKILAPPATAYADSPPPGTGITPNTVLVFDVALVDF